MSATRRYTRITPPHWTTTPPRAVRPATSPWICIARHLYVLAREHARSYIRAITHHCVAVTSTIRPPAIRGTIATRHRCHCGNTWYTFTPSPQIGTHQ